MEWIFAYGPTTEPERMRTAVGGFERAEKATLEDHAYLFSGDHPDLGGGTSTLIAMPGASVLGVAYLVDAARVDAFAARSNRHKLRRRRVHLPSAEVDAVALESAPGREPQPPADEYLDWVWEGLRQHYDPEIVARYLKRAVKRSGGELHAHRKTNAPEAYKREYGSAFRRIFPWEVTVSSPFGSAWAILQPGEATTPHCHDEEESFIFVSGRGRMSVDGHEFEVAKGDAVYLEPFSAHTVHNDGSEPLELLCVWWGEVVPAGVEGR
jgi:mannose-6-phosphate isomerase-like protein (cupin superfamily)